MSPTVQEPTGIRWLKLSVETVGVKNWKHYTGRKIIFQNCRRQEYWQFYQQERCKTKNMVIIKKKANWQIKELLTKMRRSACCYGRYCCSSKPRSKSWLGFLCMILYSGTCSKYQIKDEDDPRIFVFVCVFFQRDKIKDEDKSNPCVSGAVPPTAERQILEPLSARSKVGKEL